MVRNGSAKKGRKNFPASRALASCDAMSTEGQGPRKCRVNALSRAPGVNSSRNVGNWDETWQDLLKHLFLWERSQTQTQTQHTNDKTNQNLSRQYIATHDTSWYCIYYREIEWSSGRSWVLTAKFRPRQKVCTAELMGTAHRAAKTTSRSCEACSKHPAVAKVNLKGETSIWEDSES